MTGSGVTRRQDGGAEADMRIARTTGMPCSLGLGGSVVEALFVLPFGRTPSAVRTEATLRRQHTPIGVPIVVPSESGQIFCQFSAWAIQGAVTLREQTVARDQCCGLQRRVMMGSQIPETTSPIANPEKPLTKPPAKAASTNRGKPNPSIVAPQKEVTSTWMEIPSGGEAAGPQGRQTNPVR
jgi:hypothetical protein